VLLYPADTRFQAKKGGFKDTCQEDLLVAVFREAIKRSGVDPALIGCVSLLYAVVRFS
jgi:acetyl-CoA acetyltransferase